jgi:hypothetical protein
MKEQIIIHRGTTNHTLGKNSGTNLVLLRGTQYFERRNKCIGEQIVIH